MTRRRDGGDTLDLLAGLDNRLRRLFDEWRWHHDDNHECAVSEDPATRDWHRGTIGKLILEEAALRLVAVRDLTRVLEQCGQEQSAQRLSAPQDRATELVRRLAEGSRGVVAEALRYSDGLHTTVEEIIDLWSPQLLEQSDVERLDLQLGSGRRRLDRGTELRKRAPLHPARHDHWYQRLPLVERVHAVYDRYRGLPDAASSPSSDRELTRRLRA